VATVAPFTPAELAELARWQHWFGVNKMSVFAILKDNKVENLVESETQEILQMLLPDAQLLEVTDATGVAYLGSDYDIKKKKFVPPQPFASWTFSRTLWSWSAPKAYPEIEEKFFIWDEEQLDWVEPIIEEIVAE
jgi:hypothetical protein